METDDGEIKGSLGKGGFIQLGSPVKSILWLGNVLADYMYLSLASLWDVGSPRQRVMRTIFAYLY